MKIVILGYSGFIGQSIKDNLYRNSSFNLVCVGRNIKKKFDKNSRIKYFEWDFVSFKKDNLSFLQKSDIIINCAGRTKNNSDNLEYINIIFLKKLLKYICRYKLNIRLINLSSVSVYGGVQNYLNQCKLITENTSTKTNDDYSKSKLKGDKLIENVVKKNLNKNFSFTILRISNVFRNKNNSNLYNFILFLLRIGLWVRSSDKVMYNFINVIDVSNAITKVILKLKKSKNKIYILSDDCEQKQLYKAIRKFHKNKIIDIKLSVKLIQFLIKFIPMPKKLFNFFLIISSKVSYSNIKIRKELNFKPRFSFVKIIKK